MIWFFKPIAIMHDSICLTKECALDTLLSFQFVITVTANVFLEN